MHIIQTIIALRYSQNKNVQTIYETTNVSFRFEFNNKDVDPYSYAIALIYLEVLRFILPNL